VSFDKRRRPRPPRRDGVRLEPDEARFFFDLESVRPDHRVRSLCRQALEAVSLALADADLDERLDGAWVVSVDPAPGPERLLVSLALPGGSTGTEAEGALQALVEKRPWLRWELARAIHRKRVPDLAFRVVMDPEASDE
jgi:ribosome-binding factor A